MHEFSIGRALLAQCERLAAEHGARAVTCLHLSVGPLSGVDARQLETAFAILRDGTIAATATLEIAEAPIRIDCRTCGIASRAEPNRLRCWLCGSTDTDLIGGTEMLLESVDLDCPEEAQNV